MGTTPLTPRRRAPQHFIKKSISTHFSFWLSTQPKGINFKISQSFWLGKKSPAYKVNCCNLKELNELCLELTQTQTSIASKNIQSWCYSLAPSGWNSCWTVFCSYFYQHRGTSCLPAFLSPNDLSFLLISDQGCWVPVSFIFYLCFTTQLSVFGSF